MKNVLLHIRKADHQLRMALGGLTKQGHPLVPKVGHAVATLREVKYALEAEALSNPPSPIAGEAQD